MDEMADAVLILDWCEATGRSVSNVDIGIREWPSYSRFYWEE